MTYTSFKFAGFLLATLLLFYAVPCKKRWIILLISSITFYCLTVGKYSIVLILTVGFSFIMSNAIAMCSNVKWKRAITIGTIIALLFPLSMFKYGQELASKITNKNFYLISILGISFYTLQLIAYIIDVFNGKINPEKNILKFALFVTYFPQIVQGPIPRYEQLSEQLFSSKSFDEENFSKGIMQIIFGFFLKYMIADKAAILVNPIFNNYDIYAGAYIWVAGILYSIQLYTDFLACSILSIGISNLFGISIVNNFNHPYFATSIKDFWRRWHISLSSWLRDYIYFPLGGSKRGNLRKYINIFITFAVSGIWHGNGYKYLIWGLIHAFYQLVEGVISQLTTRFRYKDDILLEVLRTTKTFLLVMFAWIIFRADTLKQGSQMIINMFSVS